MLRLQIKVKKYGYKLTRKNDTFTITNGVNTFTYEGMTDLFLYYPENIDMMEYLIINRIKELNKKHK